MFLFWKEFADEHLRKFTRTDTTRNDEKLHAYNIFLIAVPQLLLRWIALCVELQLLYINSDEIWLWSIALTGDTALVCILLLPGPYLVLCWLCMFVYSFIPNGWGSLDNFRINTPVVFQRVCHPPWRLRGHAVLLLRMRSLVQLSAVATAFCWERNAKTLVCLNLGAH